MMSVGERKSWVDKGFLNTERDVTVSGRSTWGVLVAVTDLQISVVRKNPAGEMVSALPADLEPSQYISLLSPHLSFFVSSFLKHLCNPTLRHLALFYSFFKWHFPHTPFHTKHSLHSRLASP